MVKPYEIFDKRISHHAVAEQLAASTLAYPEIQSRAKEILTHERTSIGDRVGYIHHPFCEKLCKFCSFFRVLKDEDALARFLKVLAETIQRYAEYPYLNSLPFDAFYFGGGTPTTMTPDQMKSLMDTIRENLRFADDVEFTSESSFANITGDMLGALKYGGVNRMSLGVQTFSPRLRKLIGRECHPNDVLGKIEMVRDAIGLVNLDLVYNIPTQTIQEWEDDLRMVVKTGVPTVSIHPLVPVKDSLLSKMIKEGEIQDMGDEKRQYEFYRAVLDILPNNGYQQMNFCFFTRSERERIRYFRHRFQEGDCISFGPGAVGNLGPLIYFNMPQVEYYNQIVEADEFPAIAAGLFNKSFSVAWGISEEILFGKRVDKKGLSEHYQVDINETFKGVLGFLSQNGLIEDSRDSFTLTSLGLFWAHNIGALFQKPH
jgi:oxygen-independent coproporphyrinogen-3 oxidase